MSITKWREDFQRYRSHPVFGQINRHLHLFLFASLFSSIASLLIAVVPWAVKYMIEQVEAGFSWNNYISTLMVLIGALFIRSLLIEVSGSVSSLLQARALRSVLRDVHQRMFGLPYERLAPYSSGKLGSHIMNDVHITVSGVGVLIPALIRYPIEIIAIFCALLYIEPLLVPIVLFVAAVMYLLTRARTALISNMFEETTLSKGTLFGVITENIRMNKLIRIFNSFENRLGLFKQELDAFYQHQVRYTVKQLQMRLLLDFALLMGLLFSTFYLGKLLYQDVFKIGDMSAVLAALLTLNSSYRGVSKSYINMQSIFRAGNYLSELMKKKIEHVGGEKLTTPFDEQIKEISFEDVTFKYNSVIILKDINCKLESGSIHIIKGDNGSGKTTLIDLLLQIHKPGGGIISFNGKDSAYLNTADLVGRISVVPQALEFFVGTVRTNLLLGNPHATEVDIAWAMEITGLDKALQESSRTLDNQIGENGVFLSLGERQRLAIARAILKKPDVFIFDEPTNNLDTDMIAQLPGLLSTLVENRIILIITHQPLHLKGDVHEYHLQNGNLSAKTSE